MKNLINSELNEVNNKIITMNKFKNNNIDNSNTITNSITSSINNINNIKNNIKNAINNFSDIIDNFKESLINNTFINNLTDNDIVKAILDENNIINKILKNIFLLIISILKILSSNYVVLLAVSLVCLYFLKFLSERKLLLPCNNCENGSWFYQCRPNTGFGTKTCKRYTYIIDTTKDFTNLINNASDRYLGIVLTLINHTTRVIKKFLYYILNAINMTLGLFPPWLVLKHLIKPVMNGLYIAMIAIFKLLANFSCSFTIPIVNSKINICELIVTGIKFLLNLVVIMFKTMGDIFGLVGKAIYKFIKKYIIDQLVRLIGAAFKLITRNLLSVIIQFTQLVSEIKKPINMIFDIPIYEYFILLVDVILDFIFDVIPGGNLLRKMPGILLALTLFITFITFILPLIGGAIALIPLIKSIIYFIFGLDDNNDFKILFEVIIKFINKLRSKF